MSEDQGGPEGLNPEGLPGPAAIKPPDGEQHNNGDDSTPPPGSLPLFKEQGNPKFPKALLVGGGFKILFGYVGMAGIRKFVGFEHLY